MENPLNLEVYQLKLSLICPCYNEGENILEFYRVCTEAFAKTVESVEFVFIDDGSKDDTWEKLNEIFAASNGNVKVIHFSRNFGKEAAMYAGLQKAVGEYTCIIDTDLQQRPETVVEMITFLDQNPQFDCVAAYQEKRIENALVSGCKKVFYKLINSMCDIDFQSNASDFRTFRVPVREAIIGFGEYHRFLKGIFSWVGFQTHYIPYTVQERNAGETSWSFRKLVKYALSGITAFSTFPLKVATFVGVLLSFLSLAYLVFVVIQKLVIGIDIPGYATIIVLVLLIGGAQLLCLGAMGSYLAKIYIQGKHRPIYIIKDYKEKSCE